LLLFQKRKNLFLIFENRVLVLLDAFKCLLIRFDRLLVIQDCLLISKNLFLIVEDVLFVHGYPASFLSSSIVFNAAATRKPQIVTPKGFGACREVGL
jgi:hypothetical protein